MLLTSHSRPQPVRAAAQRVLRLVDVAADDVEGFLGVRQWQQIVQIHPGDTAPGEMF